PDDIEWSAADIENCCSNAAENKISLKQAATYIVPEGISSRDQIRQLRLQASGKYIDAAKPGPYIFEDKQSMAQSSRGRAIVKSAACSIPHECNHLSLCSCDFGKLCI